MVGPGDAALIRSRPLCGAYEREQEAASISYVVIRIFAPNSSQSGLMAENEDDSLSYQR